MKRILMSILVCLMLTGCANPVNDLKDVSNETSTEFTKDMKQDKQVCEQAMNLMKAMYDEGNQILRLVVANPDDKNCKEMINNFMSTKDSTSVSLLKLNAVFKDQGYLEINRVWTSLTAVIDKLNYTYYDTDNPNVGNPKDKDLDEMINLLWDFRHKYEALEVK
ncbi:MAG: hypothetical protein RR420_01240 [Anaerovoracaceae bacterium]